MIKITPTISNMRNTRAATTPPAMAPTGTGEIVVHGYCKERVTRYLALLTLLMEAAKTVRNNFPGNGHVILELDTQVCWPV